VKEFRNPVHGEIEFELKILKEISHPNVVTLLGFIKDPLCLVTEYVSEGDLSQYLQKNPDLLFNTRVKMAVDIAAGMMWIHSRNVTHRDLKTSNLLVTSDKKIKIADFGLAKVLNSTRQSTKSCGTPAFTAPEVLHPGEKPSDLQLADIYSMGIVYWELFSGKIAFKDKDGPFALMFAVVNGERPLFTDMPNFNANIKEIIEGCWKGDPKQRTKLEIVHNKLEKCIQK